MTKIMSMKKWTTN